MSRVLWAKEYEARGLNTEVSERERERETEQTAMSSGLYGLFQFEVSAWLYADATLSAFRFDYFFSFFFFPHPLLTVWSFFASDSRTSLSGLSFLFKLSQITQPFFLFFLNEKFPRVRQIFGSYKYSKQQLTRENWTHRLRVKSVFSATKIPHSFKFWIL